MNKYIDLHAHIKADRRTTTTEGYCEVCNLPESEVGKVETFTLEPGSRYKTEACEGCVEEGEAREVLYEAAMEDRESSRDDLIDGVGVRGPGR
jgi:hypothetical protein